MSLLKRAVAECAGTAGLIIAVIGSGIMGETLSQGNTAIALLANSIATGAALYVLITTLGPVSGAHFNPIVTLSSLASGKSRIHDTVTTIVAQCLGGYLGVLVCHTMFGNEVFQVSTHVRSDANLIFSEVVASLGLLLVISGFVTHAKDQTPFGVALYITGAYWFTSSTSFANPAVTIARMFSDTFAGIAPASVPGFIAAQLTGLLLYLVIRKVWVRI